ncbi:MAG: tetratricopeptide repeat protein, partial [Planctomycetota bacterium]|nr:tetratricopeptide repeat protein [Planctomycetota bacterium]
VVDAVAFSVEVQAAMRERNAEVPQARRLVYRIGINIGDIIVEGEDIYGDGVNVAARLEQLAQPGGICVARNVYNQVRDKLDLDFEDLGEVEAKNIARPIQVFRVVLDDKAAVLVTPVVAAPVRVAPLRRWQIAAALAVCLAVIGGLVWWQPWAPKIAPAPQESTALPLPDKPSIAVLPFDNMTGDPDQEYLADGITDDLITDLSKISGLLVIARHSVFVYKGRSMKVQQVAADLGVRYVLEGSLRRAGNKVRINAQLVDATTGHQLWAERYDRDQADLFALLDEVMGKIVSALAVQLTDQEQQQLARIPTDNLEAYDNYLRAEQGAYSADFAKISETLSRYEKAIELDPDFAEAYAGLARTAADVWHYDMDTVLAGPVARKRAYEAATRAVALQPDLPRPYSVLSILQLADFEHEQALASARRAVALGPNDAEAYINLAHVLAYAGSTADAVEQADAALRLNPKPPLGFLLIAGLTLFLDRQYERAAELIERVQRATPNDTSSMETLAMTYAELGRTEAAKAQTDNLLSSTPGYSLASAETAFAHHRQPADLMHILDAFRKAGVPQWPFGFEGRSGDRLDGAEIDDMLFGESWSGRFQKSEPFFLVFDQKGSFALRSKGHFNTGTAWVRENSLCLKSPTHLMGRESCGPVYRNAKGTRSEKNEYVHVNGLWLFEFSVAQ